MNVAETDTFESFQTKKQYKTNHNLKYNDKCLVYFLSFEICGLLYVGSTTDPFRYRWNNYKDNNRKAEGGVEHMLADIFEHFASHGHNGFLEDCTITLIDNTDGADPTGREECWRKILKTVSSYGLNTVAWRSHILVRLLYIFPRKGCYYRKMFNLVITIICTEEHSGEGSYHMETSRLICSANRLAGLRMVLVFAEKYFRAEYVVVVLSIKLLSAMVIVVLSKSLVYCYYVVCNYLLYRR